MRRVPGLTHLEAFNNYRKARKAYYELVGIKEPVQPLRPMKLENHDYVSKINYETAFFLKRIANIK